MISIKPFSTQIKFYCPYCQNALKLTDIIWQGIHVCIRSSCPNCGVEIINDLPTGHALYYPYQIDVINKKVFGPDRARNWFGKPLLQSLLNKSHKQIRIHKYSLHQNCLKEAVIVNCIDCMYGHSLLKLFNVQRYKKIARKTNIIVIIPECIRWLVPTYVHEIWSLNISLWETSEYYDGVERFINKQLTGYDRVFLCDTNCHPRNVHIDDFSAMAPNRDNTEKMITFFWRHDRLWISDQVINKPFPVSLFRNILLTIEKYKIIYLFLLIKRCVPDYSFAVVGIGKEKRFPKWIKDFRIPALDQQGEKIQCSVYAKSSVIVGTLGSHMILPAAHAFMTIELYHKIRAENFGQVMIIPSHVAGLDPRLYYFRHRIIPSTSSVASVADNIISLCKDYKNSAMCFAKNRFADNR